MPFALAADAETADDLILDVVERYRAQPGAGYLGMMEAEMTWEFLSPPERTGLNRRLAGLGYPRSYPDGTDLGRFAHFVAECVYGCRVSFPEKP
jgi:hypothetical protein